MGWEEALQASSPQGKGESRQRVRWHKKNMCEKQNKAGASSERRFVSTSSASPGPLKQKGADSHEQLLAMKETSEREPVQNV